MLWWELLRELEDNYHGCIEQTLVAQTLTRAADLRYAEASSWGAQGFRVLNDELCPGLGKAASFLAFVIVAKTESTWRCLSSRFEGREASHGGSLCKE